MKKELFIVQTSNDLNRFGDPFQVPGFLPDELRPRENSFTHRI